MRKLGLILALLFVCSVAKAQCVAKVIGTEICDVFGTVKVITQYSVNSQPVDTQGVACDNCSQTSGRYDESQGTLEEILLLNQTDREIHCKNLMYRRLSDEQKEQIISEKVEQKKKSNQELKKEFEKTIGTKIEKTEISETFKGMEIKIDADKKITIIGKLPAISK